MISACPASAGEGRAALQHHGVAPSIPRTETGLDHALAHGSVFPMGKVYGGAIDERLSKFIEQQVVFFVATAPLSSDGHVNVSPRGFRARSLSLIRIRLLGLMSLAAGARR